MSLIQNLFRIHGPQYLERFGTAMPAFHKTVIEDLIACRTEAHGCVLYQCEDCGEPHLAARGSRQPPLPGLPAAQRVCVARASARA